MLPLWTDALKGDTDHLTTTEFGAYLRLLITAWRTKTCSLPDDDKKLARYARLTAGQWRKMKPTMLDFFTISNGVWTQSRLTDEYNHVRQVRQSQIDNGRASAMKRQGRHSTERVASVPENDGGSATPLTLPMKENNNKETSDGKKATKPTPQFEFDGEEEIMRHVREQLSTSIGATRYAAFCNPEQPIMFERVEGRLIAYCGTGLAHLQVRDHEFQLSQIAQGHGFTEAWIRER